jgi:hypothetical protein
VDTDWGDYQRLPPELLVPPTDITREEAWRRHRLRMTLLPERLVALDRLARANGVVVGERGRRDCEAVEILVRDVVLNTWPVDDVRSRIEALRAEYESMSPEEQAARYPDAKAVADTIGYRFPHEYLNDDREPVLSLVHDAATLFGDELIARYPSLSWQLQRGSPRNLVYHHTVQVGYTRAGPGYSAEPIFSYLQDLQGELNGEEHRRRWPKIVEMGERYA